MDLEISIYLSVSKLNAFQQLNYIWTKIRNLDEILDEIGDFGRTKNDILDNICLLSLSIARASEQLDPQCSMQTYHRPNQLH